MKDTKDLQLTQGRKRGRNELRLPTLHFVVTDDWVNKVGEKSLFLWLRLYTLADRRHTRNGADDVVPTSQSKLVEKLGMSKSTFLRLVKPLYEYGLIDYIEYEDSNNEGQKPVNIIVYEYPLGEIARAVEPLEKVRSWEDRIKNNFEHSKKGGRPKKEDKPQEEPVQEEVKQEEPVQEEAKQEEVKQEEPKQPTQQEEKKADFSKVKEEKQAELLANGVPAAVINSFSANFDALVSNNVDINKLFSWLVKSKAAVATADMVLVIEQLAGYPEEIKNTLGFITSTLANSETIRKAKANAELRKSAEIRKEAINNEGTFTPSIPLYNWLDDNGGEITPITGGLFADDDDDDDFPY